MIPPPRDGAAPEAARDDALQELAQLDARLRTVLPEEYQNSYETLEPVPMKSAGLKFDSDGKVAWDEIWGSFCNLAMAGGPPHKGRLLGPGTAAQIEAQAKRYQEVVDEICRGVSMATDLTCYGSDSPGWVRVKCYSESMTGWLLRAITMENVAVRADRLTLELPAGPEYRLEKEIKNVVTVIAKTTHYWLGHMPRSQRYEVASLFAALSVEFPLVQPRPARSTPGEGQLSPAATLVAERVRREIGLTVTSHRYPGWLGLDCPSVGAAVWMMRALVVANVLSRREDHALFVPLDSEADPGGERVCQMLFRIHRLAAARGVL